MRHPARVYGWSHFEAIQSNVFTFSSGWWTREWLWYSCHLCCHCWWWSIARRFHIQTVEPICSARRFRSEWWKLQYRQRVPGAAKSLLTASRRQSSTLHVISAMEYSARAYKTHTPTESSTMYFCNAGCPVTWKVARTVEGALWSSRCMQQESGCGRRQKWKRDGAS